MTDCLEVVQSVEPGAVLCDERVCEASMQSPVARRICFCEDWQGNPIPDCDPKDLDYPFMATQCVNSETGDGSTVSSDGGELCWRTAPVAFAQDASGLPAVRIAFGEGGATVADASALFLRPSGLLKRADALMAGRDALLAPDGHLIARDGVVVGDYVTQLYQHTETMAPHLEPVGPRNTSPHQTPTEPKE